MQFLTELGLKHVDTFICSNPDGIWEEYQNKEKERMGLDFLVDGVIVRANSVEAQDKLGMSSDLRPKGQRCIKFTAQGEMTTLESVELSIGHTGAIIPTGKLKPVEIDGVTVSSVLLNNFEEIERLGIRINGKVKIIRAGDVIPKTDAYIGDIYKCPECGFEGTKDEQMQYHSKS